jgi:UDP-N-acetylglucosamine--N-acetylmuramyl-(pentapeptide) pyrophosphoryl-undecaprenol N-acetylglucosamine transferase
MARRIMILAGGTGGHVFPALAVADDLLERGHELFWMGTKKGLEARLIPAKGISIDWLSVTGLRGKSWAARLKAPFMLLLACGQAARILMRRKPDVVLGMGGFVAGPGALMAWLLRIPLVIHEQNRIPGTTNRLLARRARKVLEAFPKSFETSVGAVWTGNPLRRVLTEMPPSGRRRWNDAVHLLVLGGSQGAQILNQTVPKAVAKLQGAQIEVVHQSGPVMQAETEQLYQSLETDARVEAFIEDMALAYQWADVVVCRAGAMTISELCAAGLASILVPFPYAIDDHQTQNARWLSDAGAAILMPQTELNPEHLKEKLEQLLDDKKRQTMSAAAKSLARLDAARTVANICLAEIGDQYR